MDEEELMFDWEEIRNRAAAALAADQFASHPGEYVQWALFLLDNHIQSENIYILAGLDSGSSGEMRLYFQKVLEELNLGPEDFQNLDVVYARRIARQAADGETDPVEAAKTLEQLCIRTDLNPLYSEFLEISDGIGLLREGYEPVQGMNEENHREYIRHACELFLIFSELEVPEGFYEQGYCRECHQRVTPRNTVNWDDLLGKKIAEQTCPECGAKAFYWTRYNQGKDLYLKEIGRDGAGHGGRG